MTEHIFPLIEVSGDAYQMGYQHGEQAADLIQKYLLWIERLTGKPRGPPVPKRDGFSAHDRETQSRLRGGGPGASPTGADISFEEAVLCQARTEAARVHEGGCTAFALTGSSTADGLPLAGQNQDLETEYADVAILLHVKPTDGRPRALIFTFAGQLGYSGMNPVRSSPLRQRSV